MKLDTTPVLAAVQLVLTKDPLNINATKLLALIQRLQKTGGSLWIDEDSAKTHALEKRLMAALNALPRSITWTDDERAIISAAILALEGQSPRDQRLLVRLTMDELTQLRQDAQTAKQTVSAYVRSKLGITETDEADAD